MNRSIAVLFLLTTTIQFSTAQIQVAADQDSLTADIDRSVSPRDDFYQYVNGEGFKRKSQRGTSASAADEEVLAREKKIADRVADERSARGTDARLVGDLWFTGLDAKTLNKQGIEPLRPDLNRIDRVRTVRDLMDVVAMLNLKSRFDEVIFRGYVWRDNKNSDRWVYNFQQPEISGVYTSNAPNAEKVRSGLRTYMLKTFERLYNDKERAKKSADAVFDLENQMLKVRVKDEYEKITLSELQQLVPEISWDRYLRKLGIERTDALIMQHPGYFRSLNSLLRTVPLDVWKDYLRFRLMRINVGFLDDRTLNEFFEYDRLYTGAQRPRDRWQRVIRNVELRLGQPLARLFIAEYHVADDRSRYRAIAESLRSVFRERIQRSEWLGEVTKQKAIEKLDAMKMSIGFPDKWANFSTMRLKRDSYALNIMRANEWLNREEIKRVGKKTDRSEALLWWRMRGDSGEYDPTNNELSFSAKFFPSVSGSADKEAEDATLYGSLAVLGHEMTHGFDSNGRNYDSTGTLVDWWTPVDADEFNRRSKRLIDQYSEFSPIAGLHIDGKRTLAENIADLTGAVIVLDAFKKTEQFKKGEPIGGFTPLQRFFIAFAHKQAPQTPQEISAMLQGGDHSPARERVNGVLMNVPEFYGAFDVKAGDRMYLPEDKRTKIW